MDQQFVRYGLKTNVYKICDFSIDCYHPSYQKVVFVTNAKISNMVNILSIRQSFRCPREDSLHPFVPCFCPLISTMLEQSRCSIGQFVLLRVKNNLKSVKQQILDFDFELLIDIRKKPQCQKYSNKASFATRQVNPTYCVTTP